MTMGGSSSGLRENGAKKWHMIPDRFETIGDVQDAIYAAGLESSEVILAVDFTESNTWTGKESFSVMRVICKTLAKFDDDQLIPAYGFGDANARSTALVSFAPNNQPVHTFEGVLHAYRAMLRNVCFSGPTSFAPAIYQALHIVKQSGGRYHVLVIIADGQVQPDACVEETKAAIVEASNFPLSIIMVGVGDGPWRMMERFDDEVPKRKFDNFQFVNFTALTEKANRLGYSSEKQEADFALAALMEIPDQYSAIVEMGMLGRCPKKSLPDVKVYDPPAN